MWVTFKDNSKYYMELFDENEEFVSSLKEDDLLENISIYYFGNHRCVLPDLSEKELYVFYSD